MTKAHRRSPLPPLLLAVLGTGAVALLWPTSTAPAEVPSTLSTTADHATAHTQPANREPDRQNAADLLAPWAAPIGSRLLHQLADRLTVTLSSAEAGTAPAGSLHAQCKVQTIVVDRRNNETLLEQRLLEFACLDANGHPMEEDRAAARYVAAAATPVLTSIDSQGRLLQFGFADGLDGDQRNFLRGILTLLACEAPHDHRSHWHSQGVDTTGEYEARFEVMAAAAGGLQLRRSKLRYTAIVGQAELPQHQVRGAAIVSFDPAAAWLASVDLEEELTISLPLAALKAITQRHAQVRLLQSDHIERAAMPGADWTKLTHGPSSHGEILGIDAEEHERERWARKLASTSLAELLADLQVLCAADPVDAEAVDARFQELQWLLRLREEAIAELAAGLRHQAIGEAAARVGLGALGAAGSPAAQDVLADCCRDTSLPAGLREAATIACVQLAEPSPRVLGNLLEVAASDAGHRGSALLVAGALAGRAKGPLADGSSALAQLLALRNNAEARGELDNWLLAISNAKAPQTLALALELASHPLTNVRIAVCVALGELPVAAALSQLLELARNDAADEVRSEALLALSQRREAEARTAIEHAAQHDRSLTVRQRAERLLPRED